MAEINSRVLISFIPDGRLRILFLTENGEAFNAYFPMTEWRELCRRVTQLHVSTGGSENVQ